MANQDNLLDRMRIASPCPMRWEEMRGTDQARFCDQCQLHIYNISQMTRQQAEELFIAKNGKICAKLYRRPDGTVLTKDCPVGLRAFRRRVGRAVGAALTAILSLMTGVLGQTSTRTSKYEPANEQFATRTAFLGLRPQEGRASLWGVIKDPNGDVVPDAQATILNEKTKYKRTIKSDNKGLFRFGLLEPGVYTLRIEANVFATYARDHISLHSNEELRHNISLNISGAWVGIVTLEDLPTKGFDVDGVHININER